MNSNHMFWVMADSHFNHAHKMENIRPVFYEDKIVTGLVGINCNTYTLIHLGDVTIGNDETVHDTFFAPLTCKKVLVRGNHDSKSVSWYLKHGWDMVVDAFELEIYGKKIKFTHRPITDEQWMGVDINIHGHIHSNMRKESFEHDISHQHVNMCPEEVGYKPVSLRHIVTSWDKRQRG